MRDIVFAQGNKTYLFSSMDDCSVWVPELVIRNNLRRRGERDKELTVDLRNNLQNKHKRFHIPRFRASTSAFKRSQTLTNHGRYVNIRTNRTFSNEASSQSYALPHSTPVTNTIK